MCVHTRPAFFFFSSKGKWECRIECCTTDLWDSMMQPSPKALWDAFRTCMEKTMEGVLPEKINLSH